MDKFKFSFKELYFLIIVVLQIVFITFCFGMFKQGFHSDEIYEYGFANSINQKNIYETDDYEYLDGIWTDSDLMTNYLSVDSDNRFNFAVPYIHAKNDYNPPFHLFLLNFICSFFPGTFSKWFGFSINIVSFTIIQIYLYLLIYSITGKKLPATAAIVLYGFCAGCFDTISFLRMYALGTAFAVAFIYYSYKYISSEEKKNSIHYLGNCFVNLFLGAFTLHLYLVFAFPLVLATCIAMLFAKKFKKMFCYGFAELFAVLFSFLVFPKVINDTVGDLSNFTYSYKKYSDALQFRIYSYLITRDTFGIHFNMYANPWIKISIAIIIFICICVSPFVIMSWKEEWLKKIRNNIFKRIKTFLSDIKNNYYIIFGALASVLFTVVLASKRTSIYAMSIDYSSRYLFVIYPVLVIFLILFVYYILKNIINKELVAGIVVLVMASALALLSQWYSPKSYLMLHEEEGISFDDLGEDANCIVLLGNSWEIVNFCPDLYQTNSYYYITFYDFMSKTDVLDGIDQSKPLYLLLSSSYVISKEDEEYLADPDADPAFVVSKKDLMKEGECIEFYENLSMVESLEYVGNDSNFSGLIKIYKFNFKD